MRVRGRTFEVDRENGKLLGVCAGISRATGVDATIVRIAVVLAALLTSFVAICIVYGVAAAVGHQRRGTAPARIAQSDDLRDRMRAHDLRMQAIETYTASANSRLAREIEDLR
ncbi:MAG: PspC domain-containing protein [Sphingomonas sp.]